LQLLDLIQELKKELALFQSVLKTISRSMANQQISFVSSTRKAIGGGNIGTFLPLLMH
jgi:hypothetical protein